MLFPAISWGDSPRIPNPPRKTPKIQKKTLKKRIKFTPQICVPPEPGV